MSRTDRALLEMAQAMTAAYIAHTRPCAVMLVGSTALGLSDTHFDIDLIACCDVAPSAAELDAARLAIRAEAYTRPAHTVVSTRWPPSREWFVARPRVPTSDVIAVEVARSRWQWFETPVSSIAS